MSKGRILLVEDEESLRLLLSKYLNRIEFEVDSCGSAEEAWEQYSADPTRYALLLVDLTLPGMRGDELMKKVLSAEDGVPVLLSSGYPFDLKSLPAPMRARASFLQKPYLPRQLAEKVNQILER